MRVPFWLLAVMIWEVGTGAAQAQSNTTPGMGPTSPLGVPSANNSTTGSDSSGVGNIPLGSTEINTPGVSPLSVPCPNTNSNAAFDGGGSGLSTNCTSASSNNSNSSNNGAGIAANSGVGDTASGPSVAGTGVVGSSIPLGATSLATPGESQTTAVPGITPCLPQLNPTQGSSTGSGLVSSTVNGGC